MIRQLGNIQTVTLNIWDIFVRLYPELKKRPIPVIKFDKRYTHYWAKAGGGVIIYSFKDAIKHNRFMLKEIVGHEVCHIVQEYLFGMKDKDHSENWASLMRQIGLEPIICPRP